MNDNLKEIMYEAGKYAMNQALNSDGKVNYHDTFREKFAELIIEKCYEIVTSKPNISTSLAGSNMKDYFYK